MDKVPGQHKSIFSDSTDFIQRLANIGLCVKYSAAWEGLPYVKVGCRLVWLVSTGNKGRVPFREPQYQSIVVCNILDAIGKRVKLQDLKKKVEIEFFEEMGR